MYALSLRQAPRLIAKATRFVIMSRSMRKLSHLAPFLAVLAISCDEHVSEALYAERSVVSLQEGEEQGEEKIEVPPPELSEDVFPCTNCHDPELGYNPNRRELTMTHTEIVLRHDEEHRWCLDCHAPLNRDQLRLASGELIEFTESYRLCGQCHGDKYRDWRAGVHGRRSGSWNGHKTYLLCVHCHDSHAPAFKPIEPMPAPQRPHGGLR